MVTNNRDAERFELTEDGATAFSEYRQRGDRIYFMHTEVPESLQGRGIGSQLAKAGLDYAREQSLGVIPHCPFIASYIKQHPEYMDLVREWPKH